MCRPEQSMIWSPRWVSIRASPSRRCHDLRRLGRNRRRVPVPALAPHHVPVCVSRRHLPPRPPHRQRPGHQHGRSRRDRCDRRRRPRSVGFDVGDSEDEVFWQAFLRTLKKRGLIGVRLVISDQHAVLATCTTSGKPTTTATSPNTPWHNTTQPAILHPSPPSRPARLTSSIPQNPPLGGTQSGLPIPLNRWCSRSG